MTATERIQPSESATATGGESPTAAMSWLRRRLRRVRHGYAPQGHRPLAGYTVSMSAYATMAVGMAVAIRASGRTLPQRPAAADIALVSVATHKLSRLLAKDAVTSPLRAPFTRYREPIGHAEVAEEVRAEHGTAGHAFGELLSCPFCLDMWLGTVFTGGLVLAPRTTRLVAAALTAVAASDFLQLVYGMAKNAADGPPQRDHTDEGRSDFVPRP